MRYYDLVFDAASQGYTTWRAAILPACVAAIAILLSVLATSVFSAQERKAARFYRLLTGLVGILAALGCIALLAYTWREYNELRTSLRNGAFRTVEGVVSDFVPEGPDGHPIERFRVGSTRFEYAASDITSAFHRTAGQGGPVREGLRVRIADVNGAIARFEVAR